MTNGRNKEYNWIVHDFNHHIKPYLWKTFSNMDKQISFDVSHFCMNAMKLLEEYHILDIQYKARIQTLKELLKEYRRKNNG